MSTPLPPFVSGLSINGTPVPLHVEAADGTRAERTAVIDGFVADYKAKGVEIALVRAQAVMAKKDPAAAETALAAAQQTGNVAAQIALGDTIATPIATQPVQPGGLS